MCETKFTKSEGKYLCGNEAPYFCIFCEKKFCINCMYLLCEICHKEISCFACYIYFLNGCSRKHQKNYCLNCFKLEI